MISALSGINFRDVGGINTTDGRTVRHGLLYRSEGPAGFLGDHEAELRAIGVRTVCDLRSAGERETAPHGWCGPDCRLLNLEMNTDVRAQDQEAWTAMRETPSAPNLVRAIMASYRAMPDALLPHFRTIALSLIDGETPLLIHCTAGKDRTGVAIALLLLLLDVSIEEVLDEYAKSAPFMRNPHMVASVEHALSRGADLKPSDDMLDVMLTIDRSHLLEALVQIPDRWGDIAGYFTAADVGPADQERLRSVMLC